jgi:hypothetical protein
VPSNIRGNPKFIPRVANQPMENAERIQVQAFAGQAAPFPQVIKSSQHGGGMSSAATANRVAS